jgi:hypothetical protein
LLTHHWQLIGEILEEAVLDDELVAELLHPVVPEETAPLFRKVPAQRHRTRPQHPALKLIALKFQKS